LPITVSNPFKWRRDQGDIILWCVRWYLRYPISFAQMAEMAAERGLATTASCMWRWLQVYGPEIDRRCRPHLKRTNRSWQRDDIYINIKGRDRFFIEQSIPLGRRSTFR
jgi:IS6 family transposase